MPRGPGLWDTAQPGCGNQMQPNQFQALGWGWGGQGQPGLRRGAGGAAPLGLRGVRPLRQPGAHRRSSASLHTRSYLGAPPKKCPHPALLPLAGMKWRGPMNPFPAPCPPGWFPAFMGIKGQRAAPPHSLAGCGHQGSQELRGLWCPSKCLGRGNPGRLAPTLGNGAFRKCSPGCP